MSPPSRERGDPAPLGRLSELRGAGRWLVHLAAERTLLSWLRAAVSLMVLGFAVDRFGLLTSAAPGAAAASARWSSWVGLALVATGVLACAVSGLVYGRFDSRLSRENLRRGAGLSLAVGLAFLLAALGSALAVYLRAVA